MSRVRENNIKNCMYFDHLINSNNLDPNNIKVDEKSCKSILIYYINYVTTNSVKPLYFIINKIYGYTKEHNGNKNLILVHTDESKDTLKNYEELWKKIKYLI